MGERLVVVGCGGFGRETLALVTAIRASGAHWAVSGVVDDAPDAFDAARLRSLGHRILGTVDDLLRDSEPFHAVIAIGSPSARRQVAERLDHVALSFPTLVHPSVTLGAGIDIGPGSLIAAGVRMSTQIDVGHHVHIDQNATVGHDCEIGDFVRLNPQACISGSVVIGSGALIGANATVLQGLSIGREAVVGAGAVVVRDVMPGATVKGVPAR